MASPNVIWQAVRKHNSFIRSNRAGGRLDDRVVFSTEKGNLNNSHSFKYSGLANHKAIDLTPTDGGVVLAVKSRKNADSVRPAKLWKEVKLTRDFRRVARSLKQAAKCRPDLEGKLLARWTMLHQVKEGRVQKKRRSRK